MLVDDKLAKEKLIRRIEGVFMDLSCTQDAHGVAQLIRNTDLTDCQQTDTSKAVPKESSVPPYCFWCEKGYTPLMFEGRLRHVERPLRGSKRTRGWDYCTREPQEKAKSDE